VIPANIRLPENFSVSGTFNGGISNFKTNLDLKSSYGSAKAIAGMRSGKGKGSETFNADVRLNNFNVGRLIKQEAMLGRLSGTAKISGAGTDPKYMSARFSANASKAEVKGYAYRNVFLNGNLVKQNLNLTAKINDPNIRLNLKASSNIAGTYPALDMVMDVDSVNLQKINLYNEDLRFHGKIVAKLPSTNPDRLIGTVDASNLVIVSKGKRYQLDSISVKADAKGDQKDLVIKSEFLSGNISGKYNLTEIGNGITNEINKYFQVGDGRKLPVKNAQDFSFAFRICAPLPCCMAKIGSSAVVTAST